MQITAITTYKHGKLHSMLRQLGWTQSELARRTGVSVSRIGRVVNLQDRPTRELADAIQRAFAEAGKYLDVLDEWPEAFHGLKGARIEQTSDIHVTALISCSEVARLQAPVYDAYAVNPALALAMETLPEQEKVVVEAFFLDGKSLDEIGDTLHLTAGRVRQIKDSGLRNLRHPMRRRHLDDAFADVCKRSS